MLDSLLSIVLLIGLYLGIILTCILISFYAERKLAAFIQDRMGPTEVGKFGLLQPIADLLKLLQKEDIIPSKANKWLFMLAPIIIFPFILAGFAVVPVLPNLQGSTTQTGVFFLLAIISLDVIGVLLAGWASHNKYSILGAIRGISQIISYEIPVGLCVLCVVMISQTLDLQEIAMQQGVFASEKNYLLGIKSLGIDVTHIGGILSWNIVRMPLFFIVFVIFYIATLAECNRAPFDLPEGESELVGGFHTEYSGIRFALFFLAEYAMMVLLSILGVILFLGAWNTPFPNIGSLKLADWTTGTPHTFFGTTMSLFWLFSKTLLLIFFQIIVRWTYPRLRIDQLFYLCWKVLTPILLVIVFVTAIWRILMVN
jgi:NADH-quinone oxidoreductase subunit H